MRHDDRGMTRDDEGWQGTTRDDEGWQGTTRDDEEWKGITRDDEGGRGMTRDDEGRRGMKRDYKGWRGRTRDDEGWQGTTRDDEGWKGMTREDEGWRGITRDYKGLRGMTRDDKGRQGMMRDDEGWHTWSSEACQCSHLSPHSLPPQGWSLAAESGDGGRGLGYRGIQCTNNGARAAFAVLNWRRSIRLNQYCMQLQALRCHTSTHSVPAPHLVFSGVEVLELVAVQREPADLPVLAVVAQLCEETLFGVHLMQHRIFIIIIAHTTPVALSTNNCEWSASLVHLYRSVIILLL